MNTDVILHRAALQVGQSVEFAVKAPFLGQDVAVVLQGALLEHLGDLSQLAECPAHLQTPRLAFWRMSSANRMAAATGR